jgi:hypothetical protein
MAASKLHRQKAHRRWLSAYGIPPEQVLGTAGGTKHGYGKCG